MSKIRGASQRRVRRAREVLMSASQNEGIKERGNRSRSDSSQRGARDGALIKCTGQDSFTKSWINSRNRNKIGILILVSSISRRRGRT